MTTEQIFKKIYQDLKQEILKNNNKIFLKKYEIPSINFNSNSNDKEDMYFISGIEMELNRILNHFENKVFMARYKDTYFFSNDGELVKRKLIEEVDKDNSNITYEKNEEEFE